MTTNLGGITVDVRMFVGIAQGIAEHRNIPLPPKLLPELDAIDAIRAGVGMETSPTALAAAVVAAVEAGRDIGTDPDVLAEANRILVRGAINFNEIDTIMEKRRRAVLTKHTPAIIKGYQARVAEADKALTRTRKLSPRVPLDDFHGGADLRGEALSAWVAARDAAATVPELVRAVNMLRLLTGIYQGGELTLALTPAGATDLAKLGPLHAINAEQVIEAKLPLALAAPGEEFKERIRAHKAGVAAAEAKRARAAERHHLGMPTG